jgi:hypothetical protein
MREGNLDDGMGYRVDAKRVGVKQGLLKRTNSGERSLFDFLSPLSEGHLLPKWSGASQ